MNAAHFNSTPNKFLNQSESRKYLVTRDGISVAPSLLVTISSFKEKKKDYTLHRLMSKRNLRERKATIKLLDVFLKREDPFSSTCFHLHTLTSSLYLPWKHSFQQGDPELRCYKSRTLTFQESNFLRDSPARKLI